MNTSFPIILAHGIFPFDRLLSPIISRDNHPDDRFHYFRRIRSTLIEKGYTVFHSRVSWGGPLEKRAEDLRNEIFRLTDGFSRWPRAHIIAHSMGGLDARWMIYRFRMEDRIASLTTIGTPHLGSPYAQWSLERLGGLLDLALNLGLDLRGARDLTPEACEERNRLTADFEENNGVLYRTVAGIQPLERIFAPLRAPWRVIRKLEGENDGLVSLRSASWKEGRLFKVMDADHLNQIGWWDPAESKGGGTRRSFEEAIRAHYLEMADSLSD
jgi:triacylglycerol lipase